MLRDLHRVQVRPRDRNIFHDPVFLALLPNIIVSVVEISRVHQVVRREHVDHAQTPRGGQRVDWHREGRLDLLELDGVQLGQHARGGVLEQPFAEVLLFVPGGPGDHRQVALPLDRSLDLDLLVADLNLAELLDGLVSDFRVPVLKEAEAPGGPSHSCSLDQTEVLQVPEALHNPLDVLFL